MTYPNLTPDYQQFDETRSLAGDKFTLLLGFFLEDSIGYLAQLQQALLNRHTEDTARLAHTLKSSAHQFGFTTMAEPARQLEEAARHLMSLHGRKPAAEPVPLEPLAEQLDHAIQDNQQALRRYLGQPSD